MPMAKSNGAAPSVPQAEKVDNSYKEAVKPKGFDLQDRILRQGCYQAAAESPALATIPFKNMEGLCEATEKYAKFLISKIEG